LTLFIPSTSTKAMTKRPSARRARSISWLSASLPHLATERSGEVVQVSALKLGLQAGPFASGPGLILRGPVSTGCGTSASGCGAAADLLELLRQRLVGGGDRALHGLLANVPSLGRLVTCGRAGVTLIGRVGAKTSGPRSGDVRGKTTGFAMLAREAQDIGALQARFASVDGPVLVGTRLITLSGALIARGVGFVLVRRGLILVRGGLVCVRSALVGVRSRSRVIDCPLIC
jgi:hypothetical protein